MKYKLTIMPALEVSSNSISFEYASKEELENASNDMAQLLLFIQDDLSAMRDYSNMFMMEECVDGEWQELEDDED